jgi:gamma-glutamyl-gamma-aminobutyrate hydrolase PuuD
VLRRVADPATGRRVPSGTSPSCCWPAPAWTAASPLLAICRGLQVLNVALGGDLCSTCRRRGQPVAPRGDGVFHERTIRVDAGSRLAAVVGLELDVHCYHHQAVGRLADGLRAVAWSEDGVIEAVEPVEPAGFVVACRRIPEESADRRLFGALIDASRAADR